jgi:hypothetical protein
MQTFVCKTNRANTRSRDFLGGDGTKFAETGWIDLDGRFKFVVHAGRGDKREDLRTALFSFRIASRS